MKEFTYAEAQQNISAIFDMANHLGKAFIKKDDGTKFVVMPDKKSPFNIEGIQTDITTEEMLSFIRESRER
jgi:hypothetical protein